MNAKPDEPGYRWNWDTPIARLADYARRAVFAANKVFRSTDRGDSWTAISPDLTNGQLTIISLAESPKQAGVMYTGTDDGAVQVTRDGGRDVDQHHEEPPGHFADAAYVSEVVPSRFDAATVYVTVDGHCENDFEPYIWVSNDFGATFRSINGNLRGENVRTLTEDTRNPDVLYIGTETGIFLTLDRGKLVAPAQGEPADGARRRTDDSPARERADRRHARPRAVDSRSPRADSGIRGGAVRLGRDAKLFTFRRRSNGNTRTIATTSSGDISTFIGENPPIDAVIQFHLKRPVTNPMLRITDAAVRACATSQFRRIANQAGIQTVCWDHARRSDRPAAERRRGWTRRRRRCAGRGAADCTGRSRIADAAARVGYLPENPCGGGGGGGGGGGRGGGVAPGWARRSCPARTTSRSLADGRRRSKRNRCASSWTQKFDSRTRRVVVTTRS